MDRQTQINSDLNFGKWGEEMIIRWVQEYFSKGNREVSYWYNSDYEFRNLKGFERIKRLKEYDLKFGVYNSGDITPVGNIKFEVKTDKYSNTGNLCFEIKDNKKDSGVMSSLADYFVYFMPRFDNENLYVIKTSKMKELLSSDKFKVYYNYGGDVSNTLNIVIPKSDFIDDFKAAGGRVETYKVNIPEDFKLEKFEESKKVVYVSDSIKKYDDPFNFGGI